MLYAVAVELLKDLLVNCFVTVGGCLSEIGCVVAVHVIAEY